MNATELTAALESALTASGWTVTEQTTALANDLHAVRRDLVGSPRFDVIAVLMWLRKMALGSVVDADAKRKVLFATSGVRLLAADRARTARVRAVVAA